MVMGPHTPPAVRAMLASQWHRDLAHCAISLLFLCRCVRMLSRFCTATSCSCGCTCSCPDSCHCQGAHCRSCAFRIQGDINILTESSCTDDFIVHLRCKIVFCLPGIEANCMYA